MAVEASIMRGERFDHTSAMTEANAWTRRERSDTRMSVVMPNKGLINNPGENNCFLNAAVQILWHLNVSRRSFRVLQGHACLQEACIFCALKRIFQQFQDSDATALDSDDLRQSLANAFSEQHRFQLGRMDDAAECFENILTRLHFHLAIAEEEDGCAAKHCLPHQKFAMQILEQTFCRCKATSEPKSFFQFVQYVSASAIVGQKAREHYIGSKKRTFGRLLKDTIREGEIRICPDEKRCLYKNESNSNSMTSIHTTLMNAPDVVSVGIIWDTERPSMNYVTDVMDCIGESLYLGDLFEDLAYHIGDLALVGVITFYGKHYTSFFYNTGMQQWYYFDDDRVKEIGPNWDYVKDKCQRGKFQPLLLVYSNPSSVAVDVSHAQKEILVVSKEMLLGRLRKTSPTHTTNAKPRSGRVRHRKSRGRSRSPQKSRRSTKAVDPAQRLLSEEHRTYSEDLPADVGDVNLNVDYTRSTSAGNIVEQTRQPSRQDSRSSSRYESSPEPLNPSNRSSVESIEFDTNESIIERTSATLSGKTKTMKKKFGNMMKSLTVGPSTNYKLPVKAQNPSKGPVKVFSNDLNRSNSEPTPQVLVQPENLFGTGVIQEQRKRILSSPRKQMDNLELHQQIINASTNAEQKAQHRHSRNLTLDSEASHAVRDNLNRQNRHSKYLDNDPGNQQLEKNKNRGKRSPSPRPPSQGDTIGKSNHDNANRLSHHGENEDRFPPDTMDYSNQEIFERLINEGEYCWNEVLKAERVDDICLALHMCTEATTLYRKASKLTKVNDSLTSFADEKRWQSFHKSQELQRKAGSIVENNSPEQSYRTADQRETNHNFHVKHNDIINQINNTISQNSHKARDHEDFVIPPLSEHIRSNALPLSENISVDDVPKPDDMEAIELMLSDLGTDDTYEFSRSPKFPSGNIEWVLTEPMDKNQSNEELRIHSRHDQYNVADHRRSLSDDTYLSHSPTLTGSSTADNSDFYYQKPTYGLPIYLCRPSISPNSRSAPPPPTYQEATEQPSSWMPKRSNSSSSMHSLRSSLSSNSDHHIAQSCAQCGKKVADGKLYCSNCTSEYI